MEKTWKRSSLFANYTSDIIRYIRIIVDCVGTTSFQPQQIRELSRDKTTIDHAQDPFRGRSGQQVVLVSGGAPLRDPAMEERMAQMKAVVMRR